MREKEDIIKIKIQKFVSNEKKRKTCIYIYT